MRLESSVTKMFAAFQAEYDAAEAVTGEGRGGYYPPEGDHDDIITGFRAVVGKQRVTLNIGGKTEKKEIPCIECQFIYLHEVAETDPAFNAEDPEANKKEVKGETLRFVPGGESMAGIADNQKTAWRISAGRLKNACQKILRRDDTGSLPDAIQEVSDLCNGQAGISVLVYWEWREDKKKEGKFYKTDHIKENRNA